MPIASLALALWSEALLLAWLPRLCKRDRERDIAKQAWVYDNDFVSHLKKKTSLVTIYYSEHVMIIPLCLLALFPSGYYCSTHD
jgi:hypothetical protein